MKQEILKLNSGFFPIGVTNWKTAMVDIVSGAVFPVDVYYEVEEVDGREVTNLNKIESFNVVKTFEEWAKLPIRDVDEYVNSARASYRLPPIVVCANFNRIIWKRVVFPTKNNIWKRDNYTCGYTGTKLTREQLSIDHIIPSSRGGKNTWDNLITASKDINVWKSDRTPRECGLKLLWKPEKPANGMVFNFLRSEWEMFLDSGNYNQTT